MNKKTMKGKEVRKQIKYRVNEGMDVIKEETGEIVRKVKKAASEANRKGKAAVHSIKS